MASSLLVLTGGAATALPSRPPAGLSVQAPRSEQQFAADLSESFRVLFTEVLREQPSGRWLVNEAALKQHPEFPRADVLALAAALSRQTTSKTAPGTINTLTRGSGADYAKCVLKGIIPGGLVALLDWRAIYTMIRDKAWRALGKYIGKHAVKYGFKDVLKITPGGIALAVAGSAVGCAVWGP